MRPGKVMPDMVTYLNLDRSGFPKLFITKKAHHIRCAFLVIKPPIKQSLFPFPYYQRADQFL